MDQEPSQSDLERYEATLRRRMLAALRNYGDAADKLKSAIAEARSQRWLSDADGRSALYQAANLELAALEKYVHALRAFHDFMVGGSRAGSSPQPAPDPNSGRLTPRQMEIVKLIASGFTSAEIAARLDISFKTVVVHRQNIMKQLGVHEVVSLVRYAYRNKLVEP